MLYGFVTPIETQNLLREVGLAQKVESFVVENITPASISAQSNIAGVSLAGLKRHDFSGDDAECAQLESSIMLGDITQELGIHLNAFDLPCPPSREVLASSWDSQKTWWNYAVFYYFAMCAKDALGEKDSTNFGYGSYSWQQGHHKKWVINFDDFAGLSSANILSSGLPATLNLNGRNRMRVREISGDKYFLWPELFATFVQFAQQTGQGGIEELAHPEKFLSLEDLEDYDPEKWEHLSVSVDWLKDKFRSPIPQVEKGKNYACPGSVRVDSLHAPERHFGAIWPYLTLTRKRKGLILNMGVLSPKPPMKEQYPLQIGNAHFMFDGRVMFRCSSFTQGDVPHLMRGAYRCYDGVRQQMKFILDYAKAQPSVKPN